MKISSDIKQNMEHFHSLFDVSKNFDIVYHTIEIGGTCPKMPMIFPNSM